MSEVGDTESRIWERPPPQVNGGVPPRRRRLERLVDRRQTVEAQCEQRMRVQRRAHRRLELGAADFEDAPADETEL